MSCDTEKEENKSFLKEYLPYILVIISVLLLKQFVVSPIVVNGESMMKTLEDNDVMLLDRVSYRFSDIERYDIVVVDEGSEFIIKRVIGLPGEKVSCIEGKIYIDGKEIKDSTGYGLTDDFTYQVPDDEYFVLGDNRRNSMDSRYFGSFKRKSILGKTKLVIFPFDRFGEKK